MVNNNNEDIRQATAPDTSGEWRYKYEPDLSRKGQYVLYDDRDWPLAEVYDQQVAAQIVSDCNAVPKLVAALEATQVVVHGMRRSKESDALLKQIAAALAAVGREGSDDHAT
jgi:hypothetical protein